MRDVDILLQETDDALRRIETLQRAKQDRRALSISERIGRHTKRHAGQLTSIALAAGLVGLSLLRYHENHAHRDEIAELQSRLERASRNGEGLAIAVEAALQLDERNAKEGKGWWARRGDRSETQRSSLLEALTVYRGGTVAGAIEGTNLSTGAERDGMNGDKQRKGEDGKSEVTGGTTRWRPLI